MSFNFPFMGDYFYIPFLHVEFSKKRKITLGKGFEITKTPKCVIDKIKNNPDMFYMYKFDINESSIGLKIIPSKFFLKREWSQNDIHYIGAFGALLIRLSTGVPVDIPYWFDCTNDNKIYSSGSSFIRTYRLDGNYKYIIDDGKQFDGLKLLMKHFDTIINLYINKQLENTLVRAIHFASIGFQTYHIPSRFVNCIIFLETLFSNSNNEISFQLSSRISQYLNDKKDFFEIEKTFNKIKELYNLRSRVVHGDSVKGIDRYLLIELEELNTKIFNIILKRGHIKLFSLGPKARKKQLNKMSLGIPLDY